MSPSSSSLHQKAISSASASMHGWLQSSSWCPDDELGCFGEPCGEPWHELPAMVENELLTK